MIDDATVSLLEDIIPKMEGWLTVKRAIEMYELIRQTRPAKVVEIGVFGGRSLIAQALALKHNGFGRIYGIDSWKKEDAIEGEADAVNKSWWTQNINMHIIHQGAVEAIWRQGLDEYAVLVRCASQHCHELFDGIDILFVDGNHSEVASLRDVTLYGPRVNKNGWIWMDDCDWANGATLKAQEFLMQFCEEHRSYDNGHYKLFWKGKYGQ